MTLYSVSVLARGRDTDRDGKHRNDCAPQSRRGEKKKHAGIERCLRLYTDTQHTRQKRFTHPLKRETVTCSSQGKPTLVFMDIFFLKDHRLSGSGFGWVHERECVSFCVWECVCEIFFFHTKSHFNQYFNSNCMFRFFGGFWCLTIACFGRKIELQIYD